MEKLYCGIDFHKRTSTYCIKDKEGKTLEVSTVDTGRLVSLLRNRKNLLIGVEASGGTNHLVELLKADGHEVKIINPNKFRAIGIGGKKTDARDAIALADALRLSYIPDVYHKDVTARRRKSLIVGREMYVRSRVNMMNHVRGTLREYGFPMPAGKENFLNEVDGQLNEFPDPQLALLLRDLVRCIRDFMEQEAAIESNLSKIASEDPMMKLLQTIPGVGLLTAFTFAAVIDDHTRFKNGKVFASYLGLVPTENSSGDKRRMGSITRSGSEILRRYFIHGARAVIMHGKKGRTVPTDRNKIWALKLEKKIGMNKATVALAHRMCRIALAVVRDNKPYNSKLAAPLLRSGDEKSNGEKEVA